LASEALQMRKRERTKILEIPRKKPWESGTSKTLSISELFHENTKHRLFQEKFYKENYTIHNNQKFLPMYRTYRGFKKIELSKNFSFRNPVGSTLKKRRSIRNFSGRPLTLNEISNILFFSYGITDRINEFRAAPSAGALYPIEIYPIVFNVRGIKKGVYHYNVKEHSLEFLRDGDFRDYIYLCTHYQDMIKTTGLVLLMDAVFERTKIKYGERGYRFVLLDAGHIAENAYLIATQMKLGCVTIGGFLDDEINKLINADGVNESVIYIVALGKVKGGYK